MRCSIGHCPKMKDIWIDTLLKIICVALILALAFGVLKFCKYRIKKETDRINYYCKAINYRQLSDVEKKETNRLFKKHGVWLAVEGKDGEWYFWRDGQMCKFQ